MLYSIVQAQDAVAQRRGQAARRPAQVGDDRFDELALRLVRCEIIPLRLGDRLHRRALRRHQPLPVAEILP
ncbi:hypothetical protein D3C83_27140 [compost metagenome]